MGLALVMKILETRFTYWSAAAGTLPFDQVEVPLEVPLRNCGGDETLWDEIKLWLVSICRLLSGSDEEAPLRCLRLTMRLFDIG